MKIQIMEHSEQTYGVVLGPENNFICDDVCHIKIVLDIPLNNDEFINIIVSMNGYIDPYNRALFENEVDALEFKELLETYLIMYKLTK